GAQLRRDRLRAGGRYVGRGRFLGGRQARIEGRIGRLDPLPQVEAAIRLAIEIEEAIHGARLSPAEMAVAPGKLPGLRLVQRHVLVEMEIEDTGQAGAIRAAPTVKQDRIGG